jgi:uncharacterized protein
MTHSRRHVLVFFALVLLLSAPLWIAGSTLKNDILPGVPFAGLMFVCPALGAVALSFRRGGRAAVKHLVARLCAPERPASGAWLWVCLALSPCTFVLTYLFMKMVGYNLPPWNPTLLETSVQILGLFALLLPAAVCEELGWSGYVLDPLQSWLGAFNASLMLGIVTAVWHLVPLLQVGRSGEWIAGWIIWTVTARVIMVWLYNRTRLPVLGMVLFHTASNVAWQTFPIQGSYFDPWVAGAITTLMAALLWLYWPVRATAEPPD